MPVDLCGTFSGDLTAWGLRCWLYPETKGRAFCILTGVLFRANDETPGGLIGVENNLILSFIFVRFSLSAPKITPSSVQGITPIMMEPETMFPLQASARWASCSVEHFRWIQLLCVCGAGCLSTTLTLLEMWDNTVFKAVIGNPNTVTHWSSPCVDSFCVVLMGVSQNGALIVAFAEKYNAQYYKLVLPD